MPFNDLREYIARLEQEGEVQKINAEVQPVFEVGGIIRRAYDLRAPAPFFLNLRGYPGYRIFGAPIGRSRKKSRTCTRLAISVDMKPEPSPMELSEEYIRHAANRIKPCIIETATR